jgi:hypothetical protein
VKHLEVLAGNGIFVALAQEPNVVRIFEFLNAVWISSKGLDEFAHGSRILHASMDQFLFPVSLNLEFDPLDHHRKTNRKQRQGQKQDEKNVALLCMTMSSRTILHHRTLLSRWG